jgi:hypothetical protein
MHTNNDFPLPFPTQVMEGQYMAGVPTGNINHLSLETHDFDKTEQRLKAHAHANTYV